MSNLDLMSFIVNKSRLESFNVYFGAGATPNTSFGANAFIIDSSSSMFPAALLFPNPVKYFNVNVSNKAFAIFIFQKY